MKTEKDIWILAEEAGIGLHALYNLVKSMKLLGIPTIALQFKALEGEMK